MRVYRLLLKEGAMTAKEIGNKLGIFAQAVYREIEKLEKLGWVVREGKYPVKFGAKSPTEAVQSYLITQREWFEENIGSVKREKTVKKGKKEDKSRVSFIQSRADSLDKGLNDQKRAEKEICLLVSGDEVPAEVMLANKRAMERGVKIKILAQKVDERNREMIRNWQRMGMEVRVGKMLEARVIIIDEKVVYLVSYNPEKNEEGVGVRLAYPPIVRLMREVFKRRWREGKEL
jgi:sugar-specific transcriptional regulator TrmB